MDIVFPLLGNSYIGVFAPPTVIFFITFIAIAILKHHLFNIRVIATEIVTFGLWIFILIRLILAENLREVSIEGALLLITIIFGILLIRSVLQEIKQREKIESLAKDLDKAYGEVKEVNAHLSQKVAEQTAQIREAYEVEKKARADLEKLNDSKNQFIMITQHHLRTPVTNIEWELESMLAGAHGPITPEFKDVLLDTKSAADRLTRIVDDFLNITAFKAGENILNLSRQSLKPAIDDIAAELKRELARRKITLTYPKDDASWPESMIDFPKLRDILLIIVENAVKYNHDNGSISISTKKQGEWFEMTIENTGIGITPEELGKIGSSLFYRGMEARKMNAVGMGVGLSVAKAIISAHHGSFEIWSDGKDKGARVIIRLPA